MGIWFSESTANMIGAILGAGFGSILGLFGAFCGIFGSKGKFRRLILSLIWVFLSIAIVFLIAGIIALAKNQPYFIWYPFILIGVVPIFTLIPANFYIRKKFQELELQKIQIKDS